MGIWMPLVKGSLGSSRNLWGSTLTSSQRFFRRNLHTETFHLGSSWRSWKKKHKCTLQTHPAARQAMKVLQMAQLKRPHRPRPLKRKIFLISFWNNCLISLFQVLLHFSPLTSPFPSFMTTWRALGMGPHLEIWIWIIGLANFNEFPWTLVNY